MGAGALARWVRTATAIAAAVLLVAPHTALADFTPEQEARMRDAVEFWSGVMGYPGIVAGVSQRGVGEFTTAVGAADLASGRPISLDDRFHIGSVTKTFTGTLVLQLAMRGKLRLNDPVSKYVDGVPQGRRITIRNLLDMTSGIHDYTTRRVLERRIFPHPHRSWRPAQLVRLAVSAKRYFAPGRHFRYTSVNYVLLGQIIKRVTGKPIAELYQRRVFDRLGMDETTFKPRDRSRPDTFAHGYISYQGEVLDTTQWNLSWGWTAGGASSTLADLMRWAPALANGDGVLKPAMQRKRLRPLAHGVTEGQYGLGITVLALPFGDLLGHSGSVPGYDTLVVHSRSRGITFVALGNASPDNIPLRPNPPDGQYGLALLAKTILEPLFVDSSEPVAQPPST